MVGQVLVLTGNYVAKKPIAPVAVVPVVTPAPTQPAASFFSLASIAWGWVALLIILVLFITVIYLIMNRHKI